MTDNTNNLMPELSKDTYTREEVEALLQGIFILSRDDYTAIIDHFLTNPSDYAIGSKTDLRGQSLERKYEGVIKRSVIKTYAPYYTSKPFVRYRLTAHGMNLIATYRRLLA